MASLRVFVGPSPRPAITLSDGLYWYLSSHAFEYFTDETGIAIQLDAPTEFDAELLLAFFLTLEPVVEQLRLSEARYAHEVGLGDSRAQIRSYEVPRTEAIGAIEALMTAANDAFNEGVELRLVPSG